MLFSCQIKAKDSPINISDIEEIIRLIKLGDSKGKPLSESALLAIKAKAEYDSGDHSRAVEDLYSATTADVRNADNLLNSGK